MDGEEGGEAWEEREGRRGKGGEGGEGGYLLCGHKLLMMTLELQDVVLEGLRERKREGGEVRREQRKRVPLDI